MYKILLLQASARSQKTTGNLAKEIANKFNKKIYDTRICWLAKYSFPFEGEIYADYDEQKIKRMKIPLKTKKLLSDIEKADALIFLTPTYWMGRSQAMQGLMEYLTFLETAGDKKWCLHNKPVAIIATGNAGGSAGVVSDLACALNHIGMYIPPFCLLWYNKYLAPHTEEEWMLDIPALIVTELGNAVLQKNKKITATKK